MNLKEAVQNTRKVTRTENGAKTYNTSLSACVDLFFAIGASRNNIDRIYPLFEAAISENPEIAIRIVAWVRDVRGGSGERNLYRKLLQYIEVTYPEYIPGLVKITPEIGRWDDLLELQTESGKSFAIEKIRDALNSNNVLCAKWMPRSVNYSKRIKALEYNGLTNKAKKLAEKQKNHNTKVAELRKRLGMSPKQYRKTLAFLTNVVETPMCAKRFSEIDFSKLPSLASARYARAFEKNAPVEYLQYKTALSNGEAKINAGAVYPYDVIKTIAGGSYKNIEIVRAQWDALPDYIGDQLILPMVDTSGSMTSSPATKTLSCADIAFSLGMYLADKNKGVFKDMFLNFSDSASLHVLKGDIVSKYRQMKKTNWAMSTNLHAAFNAVLSMARKKNVTQSGMPSYILILSDMEFNSCVKDSSAFKMIKSEYKKYGYELPKIVFWNLNMRNVKGNVPVKYNQSGTALISGFSPAIMTSVLKTGVNTPEEVMMTAVNIDRYNIWK